MSNAGSYLSLAAINRANTGTELIDLLQRSIMPVGSEKKWRAAARTRMAELYFDGDVQRLAEALDATAANMNSSVTYLDVLRELNAALPVPVEFQTARIGMPCQNCQTVGSDPDAVFCSKCGERIVSEESEVLTKTVLSVVEASVPDLVAREVKRHVPATSPTRFYWSDLTNAEKWKVSWGVFGRVFLVGIGIQLTILFFVWLSS